MGVRELVGDANGVPASEKVKKHWSKVFERLIHNRLLSFFLHNNTIVLTQYGFRHKYFTIHAIIDLITMCYDN